jgi:hypothetical protein
VEEEVFSLAPESDSPRNKTASYVVIGVIAAVVATFLFVVSSRMDSGAHHYDTAAAEQDLVTVVPTTSTTVVAVNKFTAADAHFRASFPANPKRSSKFFTVEGKRYDMTFYENDNADSVFVVGSMSLPAGTSFNLGAALDGTAYLMGARVGSRFEKKFQGNDAYEAVIAAGCSCDLVKAFMMIVRANDRVTFIFGGADGDSEARYVAFRDSIEFI